MFGASAVFQHHNKNQVMQTNKTAETRSHVNGSTISPQPGAIAELAEVIGTAPARRAKVAVCDTEDVYRRLDAPRSVRGFRVECGYTRELVRAAEASTPWQALLYCVGLKGDELAEALPVVLPDGTHLYRLRAEYSHEADRLAVVTPCDWLEYFDGFGGADTFRDLPATPYTESYSDRPVNVSAGVWRALCEALPGVARA